MSTRAPAPPCPWTCAQSASESKEGELAGVIGVGVAEGFFEDVGGAAAEGLGVGEAAARGQDAAEQGEALGEVGVLLAEELTADGQCLAVALLRLRVLALCVQGYGQVAVTGGGGSLTFPKAVSDSLGLAAAGSWKLEAERL